MTEHVGTDHVSFMVGNMERSWAFYRDFLGLPVVFEQNPGLPHHAALTGYAGAGLRTVFLSLPGNSTRLGLVEYVEPPGEPQEMATHKIGNAHVCLEVADIHRTYDEWRAKGVHFKSEPRLLTVGANQGSQTAYLTDPDGITVQLIQMPHKTAD